MKNILNQNEFKNIRSYADLYQDKGLNTYDKTYESLDMSNKTGWSDSLVGRAFNKMFSFFNKNIQLVMLKKLKVELDNQYLKGILLAAAKNNVEIKASKNQLAVIQLTLTLIQNNVIITNISNTVGSTTCTIIFYINQQTTIKDYKLDISSDQNSTWSYNNEQNVEEITELVDDMTINVKSESGSNEMIYTIKIEQDALALPQKVDVNDDIKKDDKKETSLPSIYKKTTELGYQSQLDMLAQFINKDLKNDCVKENDYALMLKLSKGLELQATELENLVNSVANVENPDKEVAKYKEKAAEYKENIQKFRDFATTLKNKANGFSDDKKTKQEISDDEIKNLKEDNEKEKFDTTAAFNKLNKMWKDIKKIPDITKSPSYIEINKIYKEIQNKLQVGTTVNSKLSSDEARELYKELENNILKLKNEGASKNENVNYIYYQILENMNKFSKYFTNSYETINESSLNSILSKIDKEKYRDVLGKYTDIDVNKIDPAELYKAFEKNPQLMKVATDYVNKEALKEIALRAAWIYDRKKYQDENSKHYSRVNLTTTATDSAKLESTWKQLISKSKSAFSPFFTNTGKFPETLDPIALMNSDETFRKTWQQYSKEGNSDDKSNLSEGTNDQPLTPSELVKLNLQAVHAPVENNYYLLKTKFGKNGDSIFYILCKYLKNVDKSNSDKNKIALLFCGIYDVESIVSDIAVKEKNGETIDIKDIIKKFNYSGDEGFKRLENRTDLNEEKKKKIKQIYRIFRPNESSHIQGYDAKNKDKIAAFLLHTQFQKTNGKYKLIIVLNKGETIDTNTCKTYIRNENNTVCAEIENQNETPNTDTDINITITSYYGITGGPANVSNWTNKANDDSKAKLFFENDKILTLKK